MKIKKFFAIFLVVAILPLSLLSCSKEESPKVSDWAGNVFQIIVYDIEGEAIGAGTGVVIDPSGKFITNAHVMEDAITAEAIFEIEDETEGTPFTYLQISRGAVYEQSKDIFIGYIDNYSAKLDDHYKDVKFSNSYKNSDTTYSIGYPNAATRMEIHKGKITNDLSTLADKLERGSAYIGSTSFIAPGSSGGILVNAKHEIIGITSRGQTTDSGEFVVGASITYKSFKNHLNTSVSSRLIHLLHPSNEEYISAWLKLKNFLGEKPFLNSISGEIAREETDWGEYYVRAYMDSFPDNTVEIIINITQDDGTVVELYIHSDWQPNSGITKGKFFAKVTCAEVRGYIGQPQYTFSTEYTYKNGEIGFSKYTLEKNLLFTTLKYTFDSSDIDYLKGWAKVCYGYAEWILS